MSRLDIITSEGFEATELNPPLITTTYHLLPEPEKGQCVQSNPRVYIRLPSLPNSAWCCLTKTAKELIKELEHV